MVDNGASGHYFDDALIPGLRYRLDNYQELVTAMDHNCRGASTGGGRPGTASGPHHRCPRSATPNSNIGVDCAWLRVELFSVKQASRNGVVSIFDKHNPRLEANDFTLPLQELENDVYFFSLDLVSGSCARLIHILAICDHQHTLIAEYGSIG